MSAYNFCLSLWRRAAADGPRRRPNDNLGGFTDDQILAERMQAKAGTAVPDVCREDGIRTAAFYMWRAKFGGMPTSLMAKMGA